MKMKRLNIWGQIWKENKLRSHRFRPILRKHKDRVVQMRWRDPMEWLQRSNTRRINLTTSQVASSPCKDCPQFNQRPEWAAFWKKVTNQRKRNTNRKTSHYLLAIWSLHSPQMIRYWPQISQIWAIYLRKITKSKCASKLKKMKNKNWTKVRDIQSLACPNSKPRCLRFI